MNPIDGVQFELPLAWDLFATFLFAAAGTVRTIRRGYDVVGVMIVAVAGSLGGGILRDVLLGSLPPVALTDYRLLTAVIAGASLGVLLHRLVVRSTRFVGVVDSVSIGMYAVFGAQKAVLLGVSPLSALFIGVLNAVGGGLLRDIIIREEPEVFKPSHFYVIAVAAGGVVFLVLCWYAPISAELSGIVAVGITTLIRLLALRFDWKTRRVQRTLR